VMARGHTRISRELYLLPDWIEDQQRRHAVGIDVRQLASRPSRNWPDGCSSACGRLRSPSLGW
jgi:hypothetical protein